MSPSTSTLERSEERIDPRIRARRISVRRHEGRRRLRRLAVVGIVVAVVAAGALALRSPLFDVDRVVVSGADHTGAEAVAAAAGIAKHHPMLDVDTAGARRRVLALPWVASVRVTKDWPGTVRVAVTERVPVAVLPAAPGQFAVVDRDGRVLELDPAPPAGLAALAGVPPPGAAGTTVDPAAAALLPVAAALPPALASQVTELAPSADGVQLRLGGGELVQLGPVDGDVGPKLLALLTVVDQVDLAHVCTIDLRVPSAPTLTRGAPCA